MNRGSLTACARRTSSPPTRLGSTHRCAKKMTGRRRVAPVRSRERSRFSFSLSLARFVGPARPLAPNQQQQPSVSSVAPHAEHKHRHRRRSARTAPSAPFTLGARRRSIERSIETRATFRARIRRHSRPRGSFVICLRTVCFVFSPPREREKGIFLDAFLAILADISSALEAYL